LASGVANPWRAVPWVLLVHTLLGTVLVAQRGRYTESSDRAKVRCAKLRRTSRRPIAAGRIEPIHAAVFRNAVIPCGMYLPGSRGATGCEPAFAVLTLVCYLFLYTPLKRPNAESVDTGVAAFPRRPCRVLIGYVRCGRKARPQRHGFFTRFFSSGNSRISWPLAWIYREDYATGRICGPSAKEQKKPRSWDGKACCQAWR